MRHPPRLAAILVLVAQAATTPAFAQVISGESTYEDNFLHQPPARDGEPARSGAGARATPPVDARPAPRETR